MERLLIHKNVRPNTIFRVLGSSIYSTHRWTIAATKDELVAYLTQFQPDIISVGPLEGMTPVEVASYLGFLYRQAGMRYPQILAANHADTKEIKSAFKQKTSHSTRQVS